MSDTRAVFRCDGGAVPAGVAARGQDVRELLSQGPQANLHLSIHDVDGLVGEIMDPTRQDLLYLAAYVYIADQLVRRGTNKDYDLDDWRRQIVLCVPVHDVDRWDRPEVRRALDDALHYLTEDTWEF